MGTDSEQRRGSPYASDASPRAVHFRTLRLATPFQPRIDALMKTDDWYNWAGYRAPNSLWDEELEYFAIRSQAALFDISPMVKYRIEGPGRRSLPQPRHPARRGQAEARPRPLHRLVRRRGPCARRRHAVPADAENASACAARSGTCPGCSTAPSASTCLSPKKPKPSPALRLQGPTSFAVLREAGFAGVEKLKLFDLADFPHRERCGNDLAHRLHRRSRLRAVRRRPNWRCRCGTG